MNDTIGKKLLQFFKDNGLDPLYTITIISIIISISYWNNYKNWDTLENSRKGLVISSIFASLIFVIMSLLRLSLIHI